MRAVHRLAQDPAGPWGQIVKVDLGESARSLQCPVVADAVLQHLDAMAYKAELNQQTLLADLLELDTPFPFLDALGVLPDPLRRLLQGGKVPVLKLLLIDSPVENASFTPLYSNPLLASGLVVVTTGLLRWLISREPDGAAHDYLQLVGGIIQHEVRHSRQERGEGAGLSVQLQEFDADVGGTMLGVDVGAPADGVLRGTTSVLWRLIARASWATARRRDRPILRWSFVGQRCGFCPPPFATSVAMPLEFPWHSRAPLARCSKTSLTASASSAMNVSFGRPRHWPKASRAFAS